MLAAVGTKRFIWLAVNAALTVLTLWLIFIWVPTESSMGIVQRAFYVHVPIAMLALIAVVVVAVASIGFLVTHKERWDWIAVAAAETGVVAGTLVLITGSIWAKPIWGVWWTWDAKLTTTAVLWFLYVAYLMLRAYAPPGAQGQRIAAVVAILGAVDAPIIYWAANLWRTVHPQLMVGPEAPAGSIPPQESLTLMVSMLTITSIFVYALVERYRVRKSEAQLVQMMREAQAIRVDAQSVQGVGIRSATEGVAEQ